MGRSITVRLGLLTAALLLVGCSGTPASPTPTGGVSSGASPSPSPATASPSNEPLPEPTAVTHSPPAEPVEVAPIDPNRLYQLYAMEPDEFVTVKNADRTLGSGCTPGSATPLPDGIWMGRITEWRTDDVTFDLICGYANPDLSALCDGGSGMLEDIETGEDRGECGLTRHYYWENLNPAKRDVPLHPDAVVAAWYTLPDTPVTSLDIGILGAAPEGSAEYEVADLVWIYVNDGNITEITGARN